jgi:hypothetical protein
MDLRRRFIDDILEPDDIALPVEIGGQFFAYPGVVARMFRQFHGI